jgi:hypothetical protein
MARGSHPAVGFVSSNRFASPELGSNRKNAPGMCKNRARQQAPPPTSRKLGSYRKFRIDPEIQAKFARKRPFYPVGCVLAKRSPPQELGSYLFESQKRSRNVQQFPDRLRRGTEPRASASATADKSQIGFVSQIPY